MRSLARRIARRLIGRTEAAPSDPMPDLSPELRETIRRCQPCTMTSLERIASLCGAVEYVVKNNIPGAFVECGVWKGGSSMAAALTYARLGRPDTPFYLYDTFDGMSAPTSVDVDSATGATAAELLSAASKDELIWCYSPMEEVRSNIASTGYRMDCVNLVQGKVEETLPGTLPPQIAILRLDTDWYESTRHELLHLFPLLAHGGVLIIDDYGHWAGARRAVDEYIEENGLSMLLHRIDYTGRIAVKC